MPGPHHPGKKGPRTVGTPGVTATVKYHVEISPVREVTLLGSVDLAFWKARLANEGLRPAEFDGMARVLVCAVDSRFLRIPFCELSVSVFVDQGKVSAGQDACYLAHAF